MRELLSEMNVPFVEHNIRRDPDARQQVIDLLGMEAVPLTLIDGQMVVGFDRARIEALLA